MTSTAQEREALKPCPVCQKVPSTWSADKDHVVCTTNDCMLYARVIPLFQWQASRATAPVQANGWQDISTAPKDGTKIDLWDAKKNRRFCDVHWSFSTDMAGKRLPDTGWDGWCFDKVNFSGFDPYPNYVPGKGEDCTHWQPLPTPPRLNKGD